MTKSLKPQIVEMEGKRFAKVRVPVMVDSDGRWYASADYSEPRYEAVSSVVQTAFGLGFDHVMRLRFLYALVEVPEHDDCQIIEPEVKAPETVADPEG